MSNWSTGEKVLQTIRAGDSTEKYRGDNRAVIQKTANCNPPLDADLAKRLNVRVNVEFGSFAVQLANAMRQYVTAFMSNQHFFKVTLPLAPSDRRDDWGAFITEAINDPIRKSEDYFELHNSMWAAVVCHGVGPRVWYRDDHWCPDFVAIEDLRIATDTKRSFKNLDWWAVRHYYTVSELIEAVAKKGKNSWDKKAVLEILKNYKEMNVEYSGQSYDIETTVEKYVELMRQDGGYYSSDALPTIPLWKFYFIDQDDDGNEGVFMRVVPETGAVRGTPSDKFLWASDEPVAKSRKNLLHCQYGDLNFKAPFLYHSVRSLGFILLEPCFYDNLTLCRAIQHLHDNMNVWLRVTDPAEKSRPAMQEFSNYGILRSGISIVPDAERHQIDHDMLEIVMAKTKQLQQEASSSYTQQADTGTKKEQTAFETSVKVQEVNAMMSGLLVKSFKYEGFAQQEICRRFCLKKTTDPDILKFQDKCRKAGIPRVWLDVDHWNVEPVTPLGMGNSTIALASANQLMANRGAYPPRAQQRILHEFTLQTTQDWRKAAEMAPLGEGKGVSDSQRDAQLAFGTLMQGVPIEPREGLSPIEQIEAMLPLMAGKIASIEKRDNVGTPDEVQGLMEVGQYIGALIQQLASDPQEKQRVKQYSDALGNLNNQLKGLAQRGAEKRQQQNGGLDPDVAVKLKGKMVMDQAKAKATEMKAKQGVKHKQEAFIRGERRADAKAFADIQRQDALAAGKKKSMDKE